MNLKLDFVGNTLTIIQILLYWVLFPSLVVDHLSILLHYLQRGDCFNSQMSTNFLKFV